MLCVILESGLDGSPETERINSCNWWDQVTILTLSRSGTEDIYLPDQLTYQSASHPFLRDGSGGFRDCKWQSFCTEFSSINFQFTRIFCPSKSEELKAQRSKSTDLVIITICGILKILRCNY